MISCGEGSLAGTKCLRVYTLRVQPTGDRIRLEGRGSVRLFQEITIKMCVFPQVSRRQQFRVLGSFAGFRPSASIFGFCQRNDTRRDGLPRFPRRRISGVRSKRSDRGSTAEPTARVETPPSGPTDSVSPSCSPISTNLSNSVRQRLPLDSSTTRGGRALLREV